MGKLVFFAAIMAALVAVSVAQLGVSEQRFRDAQCRHEVQEKPLHACRQVVDRLMTGRVGVVGVVGAVPTVPFQLDDRAQCCQQLQGVSRECRCSAVRQMVRNYEQTLPPLELGYGGEWPAPEQQREQEYYGQAAERQQQGSEGYYGETARRQQGQEYSGERPHQQQGEGYYSEVVGRQQQGEEYSGGERRAPPRITRVRLTKVRQYVARLPNTCQMEPLECSVFPDDQ